MVEYCNICAEKINMSTRNKILCEFCNFEACSACCRRWILDGSAPKCMNNTCNKIWTRKFISIHFPKSFINKELKSHREDVLFQQETALLPETQPYVEEEIRKENTTKEISRLRGKQQILENRINELRETLYVRTNVRERREFIRECPSENCRGFLSTAWKCGLCDKWTCPECHEIKGDNRDDPHTCNPDSVATAKLLSNDTKPCPKCRTGIFKIDGCDQMWCTQCHTGFNWRTGAIETNIHNPHFFEWQRRNSANGEIPRRPEDNHPQCGNVMTNDVTRSIMSYLNHHNTSKELKQNYYIKISNIIRNVIHIRAVEIPRYIIDYAGHNRELRIQYMRNKISEDEFKILIQRYSKRFDKYTEIRNVYEVLVNTVTDIIFRIRDNLVRNTTITQRTNNIFPDVSTLDQETIDRNNGLLIIIFEPLHEINTIIEYVNGCFKDIGKTYSSKEIECDDQLYILSK
jgi:hypothetical protein